MAHSFTPQLAAKFQVDRIPEEWGEMLTLKELNKRAGKEGLLQWKSKKLRRNFDQFGLLKSLAMNWLNSSNSGDPIKDFPVKCCVFGRSIKDVTPLYSYSDYVNYAELCRDWDEQEAILEEKKELDLQNEAWLKTEAKKQFNLEAQYILNQMEDDKRIERDKRRKELANRAKEFGMEVSF